MSPAFRLAVLALTSAHLAVLCAAHPLAAQAQASSDAEGYHLVGAGIPSAAVDALEQKKRKNPTTARWLGIMPGMGHVYAGEGGRGALLAGSFVAVAIASSAIEASKCPSYTGGASCNADSRTAFAVLAGGALWGVIIFSVWDAGRAAHRTNKRNGVLGSLSVARTAGIDGGAVYRVGLRLPAEIGR